MKPYAYILAVLLTGGVVGFFVGQRSATSSLIRNDEASSSLSDPSFAIHSIFQRMSDAYKLHDSMLLFRDCSASYVEVDANSGQSYGLDLALLRYHDEFRPGKSVTFNVLDPEISMMQNAAVVRAKFSKLSDRYEDQGFAGFVGQGVWLLSRGGGRWQIDAFVWTQTKKQ